MYDPETNHTKTPNPIKLKVKNVIKTIKFKNKSLLKISFNLNF